MVYWMTRTHRDEDGTLWWAVNTPEESVQGWLRHGSEDDARDLMQRVVRAINTDRASLPTSPTGSAA